MRKMIISISVLASLLLTVACNSTDSQVAPPDKVDVPKEVLYDKIRGGWAGKVIGCTYGGPVEFLFNGTMIQDYTPLPWNKDRVKFYFDTFPGLYDDIYVNIAFVEVLEKLGLEAPTEAFATGFVDENFPLWHANQVARYNLTQGVEPSMAGHWLNNPHADDIDYQIEADFAGLMAPGMPNYASEVSDKVGHIFTYGDGWYGGVFVGALYSLAFIEEDMEVVVAEALKTIPAESNFYKCMSDVISWHKMYPEDWKQTWFECERKWSSEIGCPDGVFAPFNIDAKMNSAYVLIGLLYGQKDFFKTMDIATRCGQDADCNAATAAGILGTLIGYSNIPEVWKESLYQIEDIPFDYTDLSLNALCDLSLKHALLVISANEGSVNENGVTIKTQQPTVVRFEKSFEGHYPLEKKAINKNLADKLDYSFDGIGFVQKGYVKCSDENYVAIVEMYVDGKLEETANLPVYKANSIDNRRVDLFHKYQLDKKEHQLEFRWKNPTPNAQVYFGESLIYTNKPS